MRRQKHTRDLIAFCCQRIPPSASADLPALRRTLLKKRVRLSHAVLKRIENLDYQGRMNDFLRDLARQIRDREAMLLIYDLVDRVYKQQEARERRRARSRSARLEKLEARFRSENGERYERVHTALDEEARLRNLSLPRARCRDHCHIWKKYFTFSTKKRLERLLALSEEEFRLLMYRFASDLALSAHKQSTLDFFSWKEFAYTGFTRKELRSLLSSRARHLAQLELDPDVDDQTIRKRYKELAQRHHPDHGGDALEMRRINSAYHALTREPWV